MIRKIFNFSLAGALLLSGCASTADYVTGEYWNFQEKNQVTIAKMKSSWPPTNDHFKYALSVPKIESGRAYPLILALHGSGGDMQVYLNDWRKEALKHSTIVAVPQLDSSLFLVDVNQDASIYYNFIEHLKKKYPIDKNRIYVAGASAGGTTANIILQKQPMFWRGGIFVACANFPEAFPAMGQDETTLKHLGRFPPLLYVQGLQDAWNLGYAVTQIEFLVDHGVKVQLYSYKNAGHEHRPEWNQRIFKWIRNVELVDGQSTQV